VGDQAGTDAGSQAAFSRGQLARGVGTYSTNGHLKHF
jgi:hypothetical protein